MSRDTLRPNDHLVPVATDSHGVISAVLVRDDGAMAVATLAPTNDADGQRFENCPAASDGLGGRAVWHVPVTGGKPAMCNSQAFRAGWDAIPFNFKSAKACFFVLTMLK